MKDLLWLSLCDKIPNEQPRHKKRIKTLLKEFPASCVALIQDGWWTKRILKDLEIQKEVEANYQLVKV